MEIRVEYMNFEEIAKWPRNPKDHDLHEIRKSFDRFGFIKPVLVDEGTHQLVAGHGRLDTLRILKSTAKDPPRGVKIEEDDRWLVPVLRGVEFDDPAEAEAFLIADNRLGEIGGWDKELLSEMLAEVVDVDDALDGMGFDIAEVMDLLGENDKEDKKKDPKQKTPGEGEYLVVITCKDEEDQSLLIEEMLERGLECKALMG